MEAASAALQRIVLGHLSRDCNTPAAARDRVRAALDSVNCLHAAVDCASQDEPTGWFSVVSTVRLSRPPAPAGSVWQQTELF
jgi:hypothetical protein